MSWTVVDANIAVKWLLDEVQSEQARQLLDGSTWLAAPGILPLELDATLSRQVRLKLLSKRTALRLREEFNKFSLAIIPSENLRDMAFEISLATGHGFFDCLYVAAAFSLDCPLVTADLQLIRRVSGSPWARHVSALGEPA